MTTTAAIPDLTHELLTDLWPACEFETCPVGNPAAQWIATMINVCRCVNHGHLCCEPCRQIIIQGFQDLHDEADGDPTALFVCRDCGTDSHTPPTVDFEPLHGERRA